MQRQMTASEQARAELNRIRELSLSFEDRATAAEDILKQADQAGYLPEIWEAGATLLNRFLRDVIEKSFLQSTLLSQPKYKNYYELPYKNLNGAFLQKINLKQAYLYSINLLDADLSGADLSFSYCSVTNLLRSKSLMNTNIQEIEFKILENRSHLEGLTQLEKKSKKDLILSIQQCKKREKLKKIFHESRKKFRHDESFLSKIKRSISMRGNELELEYKNLEIQYQTLPEFIFKQYGEKPIFSVENGYLVFRFKNQKTQDAFFNDMIKDEDSLEWIATTPSNEMQVPVFKCRVFCGLQENLDRLFNQKLGFARKEVMNSIEPSAPPFDSEEDYLKNMAELKKYSSKAEEKSNYLRSSSNEKSSSKTEGKSDHWTSSSNQGHEKKSVSLISQAREIKIFDHLPIGDNLKNAMKEAKIKLTIFMNSKPKKYSESLDLLKISDKAGYLPFLWENDGLETEFNQYLSDVIQFGVNENRKNRIYTEVILQNKKIKFIEPPLFNLRNAFLQGINMSRLDLSKVDFENSNLMSTDLSDTCICYSEFLKAKSLIDVKMNFKILDMSKNANPGFFASTNTVASYLSDQQYEVLSKKTVSHYESFFSDCTDIKTIVLLLNSLKENYFSNNSVVCFSNLSFTASISSLSIKTEAYALICSAGERRILDLKRNDAAESTFFKDLASAYRG